MAVVISSEENSYFATSSLRRSHSQNSFGAAKNTNFHTSNSTSRINESYHRDQDFRSSSRSSTPSPKTGPFDSLAPVPGTKFSLAADCEEDDQLRSVSSEEHIILTRYDELGYYNQAEDLEPPPSPRSGHSYTASPNDQDTSATTSRPESPDLLDRAEDDIALKVQPSRHVDYLSHDWREEDIWESWKLIVSRRGEYTNSARLENASWRTWMKAKNNLSTVSPETLNWLKDCDVTWLYGPLQTGSSSINPPTGNTSSRLSKSNSFVKSKKPILKKRSMSEIMLQRSLSASSLVKQAAAAVQAQQKEGSMRVGKRPSLVRAKTDFVTFPFSTRRISHDPSLRPSTESSGIVSPSNERKHIHFNEQVSQCIAVDVKDDEDDEDDVDPHTFDSDSDSDSDGIMMKKSSTKRRQPISKKKVKNPASSGESKTIAMLPSTTLKYRADTPDLPESAMKHSVYRSPVLSPSSSQETLRPSRTSRKMFIMDDEDEDEDEEDDEDDDEGLVMGRRSAAKFGDGPSSGLQRSTSTNSLTAEPAGMRRTASGMFMPYEEGEPETGSEGMLGWMIDTVNTARDIVHVIRNVGWRR
ncbi:protein phosphatase type 1 complex subunit Hex2/Reg1 [Thozetella sp. PMI_491]|nr:protein phosphatase type 1 complex subunit Hex2/Reg1 [Thozetella sp. PMI_491]